MAQRTVEYGAFVHSIDRNQETLAEGSPANYNNIAHRAMSSRERNQRAAFTPPGPIGYSQRSPIALAYRPKAFHEAVIGTVDKDHRDVSPDNSFPPTGSSVTADTVDDISVYDTDFESDTGTVVLYTPSGTCSESDWEESMDQPYIILDTRHEMNVITQVSTHIWPEPDESRNAYVSRIFSVVREMRDNDDIPVSSETHSNHDIPVGSEMRDSHYVPVGSETRNDHDTPVSPETRVNVMPFSTLGVTYNFPVPGVQGRRGPAKFNREHFPSPEYENDRAYGADDEAEGPDDG